MWKRWPNHRMWTLVMNYELTNMSVYVFGVIRPVQFNYGRWINFLTLPTCVDISIQPCVLFASSGSGRSRTSTVYSQIGHQYRGNGSRSSTINDIYICVYSVRGEGRKNKNPTNMIIFRCTDDFQNVTKISIFCWM